MNTEKAKCLSDIKANITRLKEITNKELREVKWADQAIELRNDLDRLYFLETSLENFYHK